MTAATIRILSNDDAILEEVASRLKTTWISEMPSAAVFTFNSPAQFFSVVSPKRWELIERLQHLGPSSIRGLARAFERDVKRVHDDVTAMIEWGLVERDDDGLVHVPFSVIHVEFDLRVVAITAHPCCK